MPEPEVEIWRKPHKRTRLIPDDFLLDFNTIYGPIFHHLAVKTTSCVSKTGNNVTEHRLTSNATVTVERCDIWS